MSTPPPPPGGPVGPGGFPQQPGYQQPGYPPQGYQPQGYQPYGQPTAPRQGTSGMAIASLVCSLVGLMCGIPAILGIIFGFIGLSQTKDNARPGRGLAIAGLIVGILVVLLYTVVIIAAASKGDGCFYIGTRPDNC